MYAILILCGNVVIKIEEASLQLENILLKITVVATYRNQHPTCCPIASHHHIICNQIAGHSFSFVGQKTMNWLIALSLIAQGAGAVNMLRFACSQLVTERLDP